MKDRTINKFTDTTSGILNFADLKKLRYKLLYWCMFALLFLVSLICLLPTLWVALSGFKDVSEMYAVAPTLFPKSFDLGKVKEVWEKVKLYKYFKNSFILIAGCWAVDISVNGAAGYVLSKLRPIGSRLIETAVFWSMLLPGISMVPLYMTWCDVPLIHMSLVGSYVPIWLMAGTSAFNILLFRNFFNGIPIEYLEAARIDGCTNLGIFIRIIMPLSKPIVMVVTIFSITGTWSNFMWPYMLLQNSGKEPMSVALYLLSGNSSGLLENEYMILLFISVIPMIIIYAFFSKYIIGGLNVGGIKG